MTDAVNNQSFSLAASVATILADVNAATQRYIAYRRTLAELNALPLDVLLDLDLHRGNLKSTARAAVYGH